MKKQNGITIIALIITIIVMLILVGVSVTVAIKEGLFNKAQDAANRTQIEVEKNRLQSIVLGALDDKGKVDFNKLDNIILPGTGFSGNNGRYTSAELDIEFLVSEDGAVTLAN